MVLVQFPLVKCNYGVNTAAAGEPPVYDYYPLAQFSTIQHNWAGKRVRIRFLGFVGRRTQTDGYPDDPDCPICLEFVTKYSTGDPNTPILFTDASPFRPDAYAALTPDVATYIDSILQTVSIKPGTGNARIFIPNLSKTDEIFTYEPKQHYEFTGVLLSPILTVIMNCGWNTPGAMLPTTGENLLFEDANAWTGCIASYDIEEI